MKYPINASVADLKFHHQSKMLEVVLDHGATVNLSYEFLRVHSPSAEVQGHSPKQKIIQTGCRHVGINQVSHVGNYAIQLHFDDGHATGIYSWHYLADLAINKDHYWREYLDALMENGLDRDAKMDK